MPGVIFAETLRRRWRQVLYWGLGLALLGYYVLVVIPDVEALQQYATLFESMPPIVLQIFGAENAAAIMTPEGFIGFGYFTYALVVLAIYAVLAGMNISANEEEAGILDVLLSLPLPRWRLMIERFAAFAVMTVGIVALGLVGLLMGGQTTALEPDIGQLLVASINILPAVLLLIAFTACVAAFFRRGQALTLAVVYVVASYFIDFLANAANHELTDLLSRLSFFTYYDSPTVMAEGLSIGNVAVLLAAAAVLMAAALWGFQRRDINT